MKTEDAYAHFDLGVAYAQSDQIQEAIQAFNQPSGWIRITLTRTLTWDVRTSN